MSEKLAVALTPSELVATALKSDANPCRQDSR
jgi:hypothetical protein